MHLKMFMGYKEMKEICSDFGGHLSLPESFADLQTYEANVTTLAPSLFHVFGPESNQCDKFWIPLRKTCVNEDCCWKRDFNSDKREETFLPQTSWCAISPWSIFQDIIIITMLLFMFSNKPEHKPDRRNLIHANKQFIFSDRR